MNGLHLPIISFYLIYYNIRKYKNQLRFIFAVARTPEYYNEDEDSFARVGDLQLSWDESNSGSRASLDNIIRTIEIFCLKESERI